MSKGIRAKNEFMKKEEYKNKILSFLLQNGKATFKQLLENLKISKPTLSKYLLELEREKKIKWIRDLQDRRSGFYVLNDTEESSFFQQKALALYWFLLFRKNLDPQKYDRLEDFMKDFQEEVGSTILATFFFQDITGSDLTQALIDYIKLIRIPYKLIGPEEAKQKWRETYSKYFGQFKSARDLKKLLDELPENEETREIKKVLFST